MNNVKSAHIKNFRVSKTDRFTPWMITQLRDFCVTTLRVHVVGDYYNEEYIAKWMEITKRNRQVTFFAYTRSWHVPDLLEPLVELSREKNMRLWFSGDRDLPEPPKYRGIRSCYLMEDDEDQPAYRTSLVFRDNQKTVLKYTDNGSPVCPYDNGVTKVTCTKCKLCWRTKIAPKRQRDHPLVQLT